MIYEGTIQYTGTDKKGNNKVYRERYAVEEGDFFANAENRLLEEFSEHHHADLDVVAIKRSQIREFINEKPSTDTESKIYLATIVDLFYGEDSAEPKELKYVVAMFAKDINEAHQAVKQYMAQGLEDMELKGLKESKLLDFIK